MRDSVLLWFKFSQQLFVLNDNLSKTLQKEPMSALSGLHLTQLIVQTYQKIRSDEEAEPFFKIVSKKALDYPLINNAALPLKRKRPNYGSLYNYFEVEGYGNNANTYYPTTPEK